MSIFFIKNKGKKAISIWEVNGRQISISVCTNVHQLCHLKPCSFKLNHCICLEHNFLHNHIKSMGEYLY